MHIHFVLSILSSQSFSFIDSFINSFGVYLVLDEGFLGVEAGNILGFTNSHNAITLMQI